jgi:hypothetical protein
MDKAHQSVAPVLAIPAAMVLLVWSAGVFVAGCVGFVGAPCATDVGCPPCQACVNGDCTPTASCSSANTRSEACGNGALDPGEKCDIAVAHGTPGACPTACGSGSACASAQLANAGTCNAQCVVTVVTACTDGDGCCPAACDTTNDGDCQSSCGNGLVEQGETCDGNCPASCDSGDACTDDVLSGTPEACDVVCERLARETCVGGDSCCPTGCNFNNDADCSAACGNGIVEYGETCDPQATCPSTCNDGNACTTDILTGSAANCNVRCSHSAVAACLDGDGCCPSGCANPNDSDCYCAPFDWGGRAPDAATAVCANQAANIACGFDVGGTCQTMPNGQLVCANAPAGQPPPEAMTACAGQGPGDGCAYPAPNGTWVSGTCKGPPGQPLACMPDPPPPSPFAVAACNGSGSGVACGYSVHGRCASGVCTPCQ